MNSLESLIDEIVSTQEVIEFKRLEKLVLENNEVALKLERLHEVEKQAINAKELGLENTYFAYKKEYDEIIKSFEEDVLISSYLNAKEEVSYSMEEMVNKLSSEIKMEFEVERMEPLFADEAAYNAFKEVLSIVNLVTSIIENEINKVIND